MTRSLQIPAWAEPLHDAAGVRAADNWAINERQVPSLELMELAGQAIARAALEPAPEGPILIICGKGNNGGDGFVAARLLRENRDRLGEKKVIVMLLGDPAELSPDAAANLKRLPGDAPHAFDAGLVDQAGVIVDAMLGTGAAGPPTGVIAEAVTAINRRSSSARVIAVDSPTGVDASSGAVVGDAVFADLTISLHAAKVGQFVAPGLYHCGELRVADIGIPPEAFAAAGVGAAAATIGPRVLKLAPRRDDASSKFTSGVLGVVGGSTGLTGAPCLAAMAAQRTGAGYITVLVPASLNLVFEQRLLEVMSVPLEDEGGAIQHSALAQLLERSARCDALVVGPGIGREPSTGELVRALVSQSDRPLLLDADGLFAYSGELQLARRDAPLVITPHAGELARLLGVSSDEIEGARLASAERAAELSGAVVVLKGSDTIIAAPGEAPLINKLKAPGLASAGTGDVLSGMIGAYLSKGLAAREAAAAGVYAHALAGREASERRGTDQLIASDVIAALASVLS